MWSFSGHVHVGAGDVVDTKLGGNFLRSPSAFLPLWESPRCCIVLGEERLIRGGNPEAQGQEFLYVEETDTRAGFNLGLESGLFYN